MTQPSPDTPLISGFKLIFDMEKVNKALNGIEKGESPIVHKALEKMKQSGDLRYITCPASIDVLEPLKLMCPNFKEVIEDMRRYIALSLYGNTSLNFMPILLLGDPGVGKTHFAMQLAKALKTEFEIINMASVTAGWVLSGTSPTWQGAKCGKVVNTLIEGKYANPIILVDEIDKAGQDSRVDPLGALYSLLEKDTAKIFRDELVDIPVDCSHITWVATANDARSIPGAILDRMKVYHIPSPTLEEGMTIAQNIYKSLCEENGWGFEEKMPEETQRILGAVAPREMRKRIIDAMGNARLAESLQLKPEHVQMPQSKSNKIGFI